MVIWPKRRGKRNFLSILMLRKVKPILVPDVSSLSHHQVKTLQLAPFEVDHIVRRSLLGVNHLTGAEDASLLGIGETALAVVVNRMFNVPPSFDSDADTPP